MSSVDVSQVYALAAELQQVGGSLEVKATRLVRQQVGEATRTARALAPVDTGELRDSIRGHVSGLQGTVEAEARHAPYVEYGTAFTPAQPFMEPASTASEARFQDAAEALLNQLVAQL